MSLKCFGSIASFSVLVLGCQTPSSGVGSLNRPIINGSNDTIATHAAVTSLTDSFGFSFCTGTYVGLRTIVSAGHCNEFGAPDFAFFGDDSDLAANNCPGALGPSCGFFPVVAVDDPGFNGGQLLNDLSVLRISEEPTIDGLPVAPIPFTRFTDGTNLTAADEGALVSFSGFGVINGNTQAGGGTRLVVAGLTIDAVGPANVGGTPGSIDANQVYYLQSSAIGGPCSGDSGGPMFIRRNGVEFLAAVTSFGDFSCTFDGVSTRVDQFEAFIEGFCGAPNCGQGAPVCNNNGALDAGEACDGADLGGQSCASIGFESGSLACNAGCGFDDSGCSKVVVAEVCDNNLDDDGDGDADCDDVNCANADNCQEEPPPPPADEGCAVVPASSPEGASVALLFALFGLGLLLSRPRR